MAVRLAEEGCRVTCYDDGRPGASLANFGQLHSGAVYAPVLPEVAAACWEYRSRWFGLLDDIDDSLRGIGLFGTEKHADRYLDAWRQLRIPVLPLSMRQATAILRTVKPGIAAAFALPDITVDTAALRTRLLAQAAILGVRIQTPTRCTIRLVDSLVVAEADGRVTASDFVVVCTGANTPSLLHHARIEHKLSVSYLRYGYVPGKYRMPLTYWLDGDLLALSPAAEGVNVALPGRSSMAEGSNGEREQLATSVMCHWPELASDELVLRRGAVAELRGDSPDPTVQVIDLRARRAGWSHADNLVVCLPGKWTTAWKAADDVAATLGVRN